MRILIYIFIIFLNTTNAKMTDVTLALSWKNQFQFAGYYIAKEKGFYKDLDLNVKIIEHDLNNNISKNISTQKIDFGIGNSSLILDKINTYSNILMIAAINQSSPLVLMTKKNSLIKKLIDIKDKKIKTTIFDPKKFAFNFYSDILFTSKQLLLKNPKVVKDFYNASIKGWIYAYSHQKEAANIILNKYNTQNKSLNELLLEAKILKNLAFKDGIKFGDINPLKLKEITTTYKLLGKIKNNKVINFNDFIYMKNNNKFKEKSIKMCFLENNMRKEEVGEKHLFEMLEDLISDLKKDTKLPIETIFIKDISKTILFLKNNKCDIIPIKKKTYDDLSLNMKKHKKNIKVFLLNKFNKKITLYVFSRYNDNKLNHIIQKQINMNTYNKDTKVSSFQNLDYKILFFSFLMLLIFLTYLKNKKLLLFNTDKNNAQMEIYSKHICTSSTDLNGKITYVSQNFCKKYDYKKEELLGNSHYLFKDKSTSFSLYNDIAADIKQSCTWIGEIKEISKNGDEYWMNCIISPIFDKNKKIIGINTIREDITHNKILENHNKQLKIELENSSTIDNLTNIYNKKKLDSVLSLNIESFKRYNRIFSLLILDIDYFKKVNDNYGHLKGDEILQTFSMILKKSLRSLDTLGRWGGEEFIIICSDTNISEAMFLSEKIRKLIEAYNFDIKESITVSIGVAQIDFGMNENEIINLADRAMYKAKQKGRNKVEKI